MPVAPVPQLPREVSAPVKSRTPGPRPDEYAPLATPAEPKPGPAAQAAGDIGRRAFHLLNRWLLVPLLRAGLGPWIGTPIGGRILLLRVRGRRSGLMRDVPLSYLVAEGSGWVMAGFGPRCDWYRNVVADPRVEVLLPGRALQCRAEVITDAETRRRIIPALVRAAGLPAYLTGVDPYRAPVDQLLRATDWVPLLRLHSLDGPVVAGPDDPGGYAWVWRQALTVFVVVQVYRLVRRRR